jgi:hypothetical protein
MRTIDAALRSVDSNVKPSREKNPYIVRQCLIVGVAMLLLLPLSACGGSSSKRSVEAYCDTVAKRRDRYLSAMDAANGSGGLGGLLGGFAAIGDIKTMWVDLAKVAPDEIQTDTEAVRDSWEETEDAAKSGDYISVISNAIINSSAAERVNDYITDNCGAENAPM